MILCHCYQVVSSAAVYNAMRDAHPDALAELFQPYPWHWEGVNNWHTHPVMAWTPPSTPNGTAGFTSYLSPTYIEQSQFIPEVR